MEPVILAAKDNSLSIEVAGNRSRWESKSLGIEVAGRGWTYFHLVGQKTIYLGADIASRLSHLRDWLLEDDPSDWRIQGKINGIPIVHVFLTSERHHVLYAGVDGTDRMLFWYAGGVHQPDDQLTETWTKLDADLYAPIPLTGVMRLSPDHRGKWVEALTTILESI